MDGPVLALDTAGRSAGAALALPGPEGGWQVAAEVRLNTGRTASRQLLPAAEYLLATAGVEQASLTGLAVTLGPGWFTGLRIGLASAMGLALGLSLPSAGVSTLRVLAQSAAAWRGTLWAVMDARRDLVYAAPFRAADDGLERLEQDAACTPERLARMIEPPALLVGDGARLHWEALYQEGLELAPPDLDLVSPGLLALIGAARLARGEGMAPGDLTARYLRPSDAEIRFGLPLDDYRLLD